MKLKKILFKIFLTPVIYLFVARPIIKSIEADIKEQELRENLWGYTCVKNKTQLIKFLTYTIVKATVVFVVLYFFNENVLLQYILYLLWLAISYKIYGTVIFKCPVPGDK